jgi:S-adenosylmethionine hydrolase
VAVAVDDQIYIAPDNGVLSDVLHNAAGRVMATQITNAAFWQHPVSTTFHGRDVFAPVAAHIASGVPITALGSAINPDTLARLDALTAQVEEGRAVGCISYIDVFGNAVTTLSRQHLSRLGVGPESLLVTFGEGHRAPLKQTYGSVESGQPVAVIGSCGRLEVAINGESAATRLGLQFGQTVEVRVK